MAKAIASIVLLAFLTSCGGPEVWIPQGASRPAVTREHVQFFEQPPSRPYAVVGIITPPAGQYETEAEAVKAMRKEAAKHGADAIYIESATKEGGWRFGFSRFGGEAVVLAMSNIARKQSFGSRSGGVTNDAAGSVVCRDVWHFEPNKKLPTR